MPNSDRYHTAIHEAGHAVIGRVLGMVCGHATIAPDADSAGHHFIADPWMTYEQWDSAGKYRDLTSVLRGRIVAFMAGVVAERELLGRDSGGDGDDQRQIAWMSEELPGSKVQQLKQVSRLQKSAVHLVRRHEATIREVANALMEEETLPATKIDDIVC